MCDHLFLWLTLPYEPITKIEMIWPSQKDIIQPWNGSLILTFLIRSMVYSLKQNTLPTHSKKMIFVTFFDVEKMKWTVVILK